MIGASGFGLVIFILAGVLRQDADATLFPDVTPFTTVDIVDHGYHAGIVLQQSQLKNMATALDLLKLRAALDLFEGFDRIEIGWGEKEFYRNVPAATLSSVPLVLRALFNPANQSVLHIVGLNGNAKSAFPRSDHISLEIGEEGFRRIAIEIDRSFSNISPLGPGLYGTSAFFESGERYSLLNTCNHWVGQVLARAGLPYAPVESFVSGGLMFDLRRRGVHSKR